MAKKTHNGNNRQSTAIVTGIISTTLALGFTAHLSAQCVEGWASLGSGTGNLVRAAIESPDGGVIVGGLFTSPESRIAEWDGTSWQPLDNGMNGSVFALAALPNGDIIAAGSFTSPANRIARWDGSEWHPLGDGIDNNTVFALTVLPNGDVIAGGTFTSAGGASANRVARWDGSQWHPLGGGIPSGTVFALATLPNGNVVAGGQFTSPASRLAQWDGSTWSGVGGGADNIVRALTIRPNGNLIVGGEFTFVGGFAVLSPGVSEWTGTQWLPYGKGGTDGGQSGAVFALTPLGDDDVIVGGNFTVVFDNSGNAIPMNRVTRWDGSQWLDLEGGVDGFTAPLVAALEVLSDGDLMVGGQFDVAGGDFGFFNVARFGRTSNVIADCGDAEITVTADSSGTATVTLDGSGSSSDADPEPSFFWSAADDVTIADPTSAVATAEFPVGTHTVTLTVSDVCGTVETCQILVIVEEDEAVIPEVTVTTDVSMLWPPNHKMQPVTILIETTSDCIGAHCAIPLLVQATSSEPDNVEGNGDGNTTGDVNGEDGYESPVDITGLFTYDEILEAWVATIDLRAERAGSGNGRTYGIEVLALNDGLHVSLASTVVVVPKSKGGKN